jgi:nitrite reductase (NADH) large subunit
MSKNIQFFLRSSDSKGALSFIVHTWVQRRFETRGAMKITNAKNEKQRLVIIGNGMIAGRLLEELHYFSPDQYKISVFDGEGFSNYNRIMLPEIISEKMTTKDLVVHDESWHAQRNIEFQKGVQVVEIDRDKKLVRTDRGHACEYDKLVLAVGSIPNGFSCPGNHLKGISTFRTLTDAVAITSLAKTCANATVLGGGLLGLEAGAVLCERGITTNIVHCDQILMNRQLNVSAATFLQRKLESKGLRISTATDVTEIIGSDRVQAVRLRSGDLIPCELLLLAIGIRPNTALARAAGLRTDHGIVIDRQMRTSDPDIYAIGECAELDGNSYGLLSPLHGMAKIAARHLAGDHLAEYGKATIFSRLKISGIDLFVAGNSVGRDSQRKLVFENKANGIYKQIAIKNDRIDGFILMGDIEDGPWFFKQMEEEVDVSADIENLIFGKGYYNNYPLDPNGGLCGLAS